MSLATMADQEVHVDDEGFLTEYDEWNEQLARQLAGQHRHRARAIATWRRSAS